MKGEMTALYPLNVTIKITLITVIFNPELFSFKKYLSGKQIAKKAITPTTEASAM